MAAPIEQLVAERLRDVADFPSPGVVFKDITPLLSDGPVFAAVIRDLAARFEGRVDVVAGVEARGFILGAPVAYELGLGFVPVRKAGKLPSATIAVDYDLEYGSARIEMHDDGVLPGARVLLLDDVLATGGTAAAACSLLELAGAEVVAFAVLVELAFLGGRSRLAGRDVHAVLTV